MHFLQRNKYTKTAGKQLTREQVKSSEKADPSKMFVVLFVRCQQKFVRTVGQEGRIKKDRLIKRFLIYIIVDPGAWPYARGSFKNKYACVLRRLQPSKPGNKWISRWEVSFRIAIKWPGIICG